MTPTRHKRGDTRPDGFRFGFYYHRQGKLREAWLAPGVFRRWADQTRAAVTKWRAKQRAGTEGTA